MQVKDCADWNEINQEPAYHIDQIHSKIMVADPIPRPIISETNDTIDCESARNNNHIAQGEDNQSAFQKVALLFKLLHIEYSIDSFIEMHVDEDQDEGLYCKENCIGYHNIFIGHPFDSHKAYDS